MEHDTERRYKGRISPIHKDDVRATLLAMIRQGAAYEHACDASGISDGTFRNWMARGEQADAAESEGQDVGDEAIYAAFYRDVRQAKGAMVGRMLARIDAATKTDWRAAAWKLERRYPHLYGRSADVAALLAEMSDEELYRVAAGHGVTQDDLPAAPTVREIDRPINEETNDGDD